MGIRGCPPPPPYGHGGVRSLPSAFFPREVDEAGLQPRRECPDDCVVGEEGLGRSRLARPAKVGGVWETARGGLLRRWAYRRCAPSAVRRRDLLVHGCTGQEHAARRLGAADPAPRAGSGQDALPAEEVGQEHLLELWGQFCARQLVE